jgi:hypothetical protein
MEVNVQIQGVPETLYKRDRSATGLPVRCRDACTAANQPENGTHKNLQDIPDQC